MPVFTDLLATLAVDPYARGKQFEHICRWYLMNDPQYRVALRKVWLWGDWSGRWGADAGIDLVAEDHAGRLWAVQAKAYDPQYTVTKADVDTFLAESSRAVFSYRLLIATTDRLSPNGRRTIDAQEKATGFVGLSDLLTSDVDWPASLDELRPSPPPEPAKPRDYQREAIDAVIAGFHSVDRGQLIMACGTGKTLTAQFIAEELQTQRTLVLVPSLSLLKQTMRVWQTNSPAGFEVMAVCSDATVGRDEDSAVTRVSDLGMPVTTEPADIAAFLRKRSGPRVVFATYQSSPRIAAAYELGRVPVFDIVIADEAHRCAGPVSSEFATVLDAGAIKAKRRLFMTATPRYYTGRITRAAAEADFEVASMDDEARFGEVFHRLGFSEAIRRDLLTDYQVVVVGVDDATYLQWAERGTLVTRDDKNIADARSLAGQIGLAKAMRKYDLRRVISFHSRVKRAREFATELPDVINWMPARQRPKGRLWARPATGEMSAGERHVLLQHLAHLEDGQRGLLTNARCLAEGVDVPALDGVAFIDPRRSEVDIVQAVGRAIRKSEDKAVGTIVIPVFIDTDTDPEKALDDSVFKPVWDVVKALRAHDESLAEQLDSLRRSMGRRRGVPKLPSKIRFDLPVQVGADFVRSFDTRLVEQTTTSWELWFGLLEEYVAKNGTSRVPSEYVVNGCRLGRWVIKQRTRWNELDRDRKDRLGRLPEWTLNTKASLWDEGFQRLQEYVDRHGTALVPGEYVVSNYRLGRWVIKQRSRWDSLSAGRKDRLSQLPGWTRDSRDSRWEEGFQHLIEYVAEHGHALPPALLEFRGYKLGQWVSIQRGNWNSLTKEQRHRLGKVPGWTGDVLNDRWEIGFQHLQKYIAEHGDSRVPQTFVADNFKLGSWVATQRTRWNRLEGEQRQRLQELPGWATNARVARWEHGFQCLQSYVDEHGDALVSQKYVVDGFKLGQWVSVQRTNWDSLNSDRKARLTALAGWAADTRNAQWALSFQRLADYVNANGSAAVHSDYVVDGFKLGRWVVTQRRRWDSLSADQQRRLGSLPGWTTDRRADQLDEALRHLVEYTHEHGNAQVPKGYVVDGFKLGQWVANKRARWEDLDDDQKQQLLDVPGWTTDVHGQLWEQGFRHLQVYAKKTGNTLVPRQYVVDGYKLGQWVSVQRQNHRKGKLSPEREAWLRALPGWQRRPL